MRVNKYSERLNKNEIKDLIRSIDESLVLWNIYSI